MAKILVIKADKNGGGDIDFRLPESMTPEERNDALTEALPLAIASLAMELNEGSRASAFADLLTMFHKANNVLAEMLEATEEEEDNHDCSACECEGDDCPHH